MRSSRNFLTIRTKMLRPFQGLFIILLLCRRVSPKRR